MYPSFPLTEWVHCLFRRDTAAFVGHHVYLSLLSVISPNLLNFPQSYFFLFQNENKMNEAIQYSHFIYLLCTLLLLFLSHIGLIFFPLAQHLVKHHRWSALSPPTLCFFIVPLLEPVIKIDFLLGKKLPNGQLCHTAHVTALTSRNCRRSRGPTKAGLWIAWCCVTR